MMAKIAVQMLVGQFEEPFLEAAIESVLWADYFTVCCTAPNTEIGDKNLKTVMDMTEGKARVDYLIPEDVHSHGYFSFSDARNKCLSLTDIGDYVFIVDSDDVHFPEWEDMVKEYIKGGADSITAHFYHLMVYRNLYQYVQPREIIYQNYPGTTWVKGVHEVLNNEKRWPIVSDYHYIHYGYIKPQTETFKRWKFYSDLEGDFHHYDGQNPEKIVEDRISVSKPLPIHHPPSVIKTLKNGYPDYKGYVENTEYVAAEKAGLILITYNDAEILDECLTTLSKHVGYPEIEVLVIDNYSSDNTLETLEKYKEDINLEIVQTSEYTSLVECLNFGLGYFRVRHDIQYIGWIHPDMVFHDPKWLYWLWKELQIHPKIGKICAANSRDTIPSEIHPGHEQCYIVRKDVVNKIGLFDTNFVGIGGYEDWDWNKRLLNHDGYKVMITPRSKVYHRGMATRERRDTTEEQIKNAEYYSKKWKTNESPV